MSSEEPSKDQDVSLKVNPIILTGFLAVIIGIIWVCVSHHQKKQDLKYLALGWPHKEHRAYVDRLNDLCLKGRYIDAVDLMEEEYARYERCMADMGGLEEVTRMRGSPMKARSDGVSVLFTRFATVHIEYLDYNAQFTPKGVEEFLMRMRDVLGSPEFDIRSLSQEMKRSSHPMIQAYGLWFLMQYEHSNAASKEFRESEVIYPGVEAYREHAYRHAQDGEAWAYGFAAHASWMDRDEARAAEMREAYRDATRSR